MSFSTNYVAIGGHLAADPEIRYTQSSKAVATYRILVNPRTSSENASPYSFTCTAWSGMAEYAEKHFQKGTCVVVTGRLENDNYQKDGRTVYGFRINVGSHETAKNANTNFAYFIGIGNLTSDPAYRTAADGKGSVCNFSIGINKVYRKDRAANEPTSDFIRVVAFDKRADFASKYLKKGMPAVVNGYLRTGSYTDKETGQKVWYTDVVAANDIGFASRKDDGTTSTSASVTPPAAAASAAAAQTAPTQDADGFMNIPDGIDEELPFM